MNEPILLFGQPWVERAGWTLLHFLWQGTAIAALFAAARRRINDAPRRYMLSCATLAVMLVAPVVTFGWLSSDSATATQTVAAGAAPIAGPAGATATNPPMQGAMPWLVVTWFAGVAVFSVRLAGGWLSAARLRFSGARPAPAEWQEALARLIARMGVTRSVRLLVSTRVEAPAVLGWLRPVVLAPVGALTGLPPEQVEALLAHELAHVLRNDYVINLLQGVAEAVLFYHPAVWWISKQIRAERELCCDDLAVAASGDVLTYARALAELESCRPSRMGIALASGGGSLVQRIARLVEPSRPAGHTMPGAGAAWVLSVLLLLAVCGVAISGAQAPAVRGEYPTVDRATIWIDTVKQGDVPIQVRGLGTLTSPAEAELKIAESQMKVVQLGQAVVIDLRAKANLVGIVSRIHPGATEGVVTVDVHIPGKLPPQAAAGVQVDGIITVGRMTNVVYVGRPVSGRADSEGSLLRLEPDGKQAVRVKVRFGRSAVNLIEVRTGLQPGDQVILNDMSKYQDADRVNLK